MTEAPKRQPRFLQLLDHMAGRELADELDKLVFTATHEWQRMIIVDRNVRDLLVRELRKTYGKDEHL